MENSHQSYHPWLHRLAILTAGATFVLLLVGGLVTSTGSGLAVPDWPSTFGYNMFFYPLSKMVGGILYEHSHRLMGSIVGLLTIALVIGIWVKEPRKWMRWLSMLALVGVIAQGVLGGLRVVLLQTVLAIIHACLAQAFFALTVSFVLFTSREWQGQPQQTQTPDAARLQRLGVLTTSLIYLQLIFGAVLRHTGARLDAHLLFAVLVTIHVFMIVRRVLRDYSHLPRLTRLAAILGGLLLLQLMLGIGAYLSKFTAFENTMPAITQVAITTVHVGIGALMLVTSLALTLRAYRWLASPASLNNQEFIPGEISA